MSSIFSRKLGLNILFIAAAIATVFCNDTFADWPMWGGTPGRNMVSDAKSVSLDFDLEEGVNVVWSANLGSQTYGNPTVA